MHPPRIAGIFFGSFKSTELGDAVVRDTKPCHYLKVRGVKLVDHLQVVPPRGAVIDMYAGSDHCPYSSPTEDEKIRQSLHSKSDQVRYIRVRIDIGKWTKDNPNDKLGVFRCHNTSLLAPIHLNGTLNIPFHTQYASIATE